MRRIIPPSTVDLAPGLLAVFTVSATCAPITSLIYNVVPPSTRSGRGRRYLSDLGAVCVGNNHDQSSMFSSAFERTLFNGKGKDDELISPVMMRGSLKPRTRYKECHWSPIGFSISARRPFSKCKTVEKILMLFGATRVRVAPSARAARSSSRIVIPACSLIALK
jgi:hypothetical protein